MSDFPPIFVEPERIVDVELRGDGKLLDIDDFHEKLNDCKLTSRMMRLLVCM